MDQHSSCEAVKSYITYIRFKLEQKPKEEYNTDFKNLKPAGLICFTV